MEHVTPDTEAITGWTSAVKMRAAASSSAVLCGTHLACSCCSPNLFFCLVMSHDKLVQSGIWLLLPERFVCGEGRLGVSQCSCYLIQHFTASLSIFHFWELLFELQPLGQGGWHFGVPGGLRGLGGGLQSSVPSL